MNEQMNICMLKETYILTFKKEKGVLKIVTHLIFFLKNIKLGSVLFFTTREDSNSNVNQK